MGMGMEHIQLEAAGLCKPRPSLMGERGAGLTDSQTLPVFRYSSIPVFSDHRGNATYVFRKTLQAEGVRVPAARQASRRMSE